MAVDQPIFVTCVMALGSGCSLAEASERNDSSPGRIETWCGAAAGCPSRALPPCVSGGGQRGRRCALPSRHRVPPWPSSRTNRMRRRPGPHFSRHPHWWSVVACLRVAHVSEADSISVLSRATNSAHVSLWAHADKETMSRGQEAAVPCPRRPERTRYPSLPQTLAGERRTGRSC